MGIKVEKGEGGKFFAVKKVLKIGGRKHIPSVCYPLTEDIVDTINKLSAEGLVVIYPERMRFLSGRAVVADQANVAEEPRIVYLPPKLQVVSIPEVEEPSGNGNNGNHGNGNNGNHGNGNNGNHGDGNNGNGNGNDKVKTKSSKNSSSVSTDGKGEFASQELS